jgi:hypothetical protein
MTLGIDPQDRHELREHIRACARNPLPWRKPMIVNGNTHLANMEVHEYDGLKFVTESPQPGAIRLTIYRGDETTPMSKEVYGNENCTD